MSAAAPRATHPDTRRNLAASTWDGVAFSVMVGAGEKYLQAFAVAIGHGDLASGLVATLPALFGATLQLVAPWAVVRVGSQRRFVVACSVLQVLSWVPLVAGAAAGRLGVVPFFAAVTLYWATGFASAPAWTVWMETLVPERIRQRYFSRRSAACQAATFVSLVAAGALLHAAEREDLVLQTFLAVFAAAAVARAVSTAYLVRQTEPVPLAPDMARVPFTAFLARLRTDRPLRLLFCIIPLQFAVHVAEPFFAPYVLKRLHASYGDYLVLTAAGFLGRILVLPAAGTLARRVGARRILWAGALGLVPVAAMWTLSDRIPWLTSVQLAAGAAWGCYELGSFLLYYEAVPHQERASALTAFFFTNALAVAAGSLAGGWLLETLGTDRGAYVGVFAASTAARMVAVLVIAPLRK